MSIPEGVTEPAWLEVDLDALAYNIRAFKKHAGPRVLLMPVVKAEGYGAGAAACAETALASGADALGVIRVAEAVNLRKNGITAPILNIGYCTPGEIPLLMEHRIIQTVHRLDLAEQLDREARRRGRTIEIHVNVDTGMCRSGLPLQTAGEFFEGLKRLGAVRLTGVFTHFPSADEEDRSFALEQVSAFRKIQDMVARMGFQNVVFHAANTAAGIDLPGAHFDMVRPGIGIYGLYGSRFVSRSLGLKPICRFRAVVSHVFEAAADTGVSYGLTYRAPRDTTIAVVQAGYCDGVNRKLSNKGEVIIRGRKYPIAGRVTMDQTMVDLGPGSGVDVMDVATIIGGDGDEVILMDDMAESIDTISYEIQCSINPRVPRVYMRDGRVERIMRIRMKAD